MKNLTAASRITIGLVCSMVGILITANFLGLLPDQNVVITQGRAQLTESLAFSTSLLLSNNVRTGIEQILRNVATRQKQVRSIGVRRADGVVVVAVGDHNTLWPATMSDNSNATFMQVPLSHTSEGTWGKLEVSFLPLDSGRWYAFADSAQQQIDVDWFRQESGAARFDTALAILFHDVGRECQNWRCKPMVTQRAGRRKAVHHRHLHVHQQKVISAAAGFFDRNGTVLGFVDGQSSFSQNETRQLTVGLRIVRYQNSCRLEVDSQTMLFASG